jgi:hypothetical protein
MVLLQACAGSTPSPHRYGIATSALPAEFRDGRCDDPGETDRLLAAYGRVGQTPMVALGDSLYNGVQSLRANWWLEE